MIMKIFKRITKMLVIVHKKRVGDIGLERLKTKRVHFLRLVLQRTA